MSNHHLNITDELLDQIKKLEPKSILEFGSGYSTAVLRKDFDIISIEENLKRCKGNAGIKHVSIDPKTGFYELDAVRAIMDKQEFDLVVLDGPLNEAGWKSFKELDMAGKVIIVPKVNRSERKKFITENFLKSEINIVVLEQQKCCQKKVLNEYALIMVKPKKKKVVKEETSNE